MGSPSVVSNPIGSAIRSARALFLAAGFALLGAASALAQDKPDISKLPVPGKDLPVKVAPDETLKFDAQKLNLNVGEKLEYAIRWNGVPAGETRMEVKSRERMGDANKGPEVYAVSCKTRSSKFVSSFYEVKDNIKSLIDVEEGCSRHFQMEKNEGSVSVQERITFDYDPAKMVAAYEIEKPDGVRIRNVPVSTKCLDALSCLYYLRKVPLKLGGTARIPVHTERKSWDLKVKVVRREIIEVPGLGEAVQCLVVEPDAQFEGIFVRKGRMTVWLEESTHVPVRMDVDIPIGSARVLLSKFEKSPLNRDAEPQD